MTRDPDSSPFDQPSDPEDDRTVQFSSLGASLPVLNYRIGRFIVRTSDGRMHERVIDLPLVRIGSSPKNDVQVADPSVSRFHCELRYTDQGFLLRDLDSTNGTMVSGLRIKEAIVQSDVELKLGRSSVRFIPGQDQARVDASRAQCFGRLVGRSRPMREIFGILEKLAPTDLTVLILGETGTGKDLVARSIHEAGPRRDGPFVVFDAGAVSQNLIESELFGHERGAFTGATEQRKGAFEQADGGTLFIDEIGELALELQPKLLRALEQREVQRVGGSKRLPVDVRVICATNRNLTDEVRQGRFRDDLYFRISVVALPLHSLRERRDDIPLLVERFLGAAGPPQVRVSDEAMHLLTTHPWPGNVRELRNSIEAAKAMCNGAVIQPGDLRLGTADGMSGDLPEPLFPSPDTASLAGRTLEDIERAAIAETLASLKGNRTAAARTLGIAPSTLYLKIKKYQLD